VTATSDPVVSVIVPAYNAGKFVRESVASALDQTFTALEVLVIDDGSAVPVEWVVQLDPARVRYQFKTNGGPSSARNLGARLARGRLLAFLDADDLWAPNKLRSQVDALEASPRAAFAYGAFAGIDEIGDPLPRPARVRPSGDIAAALFMYNFITTSSVVVRRDLFQEMGGFDESLVWSEDYDLWMRLAERHEAVCVPGIVGSYRMNANGLSRNFARLYETERLVVDRALARGARPEFQRQRRRRLGQLYFEFGYDCLRAGQVQEARRRFLESLRFWPLGQRAWVYLLRTAAAGS
jgi:glycosyltransferase involved in cell wall biosynthesis